MNKEDLIDVSGISLDPGMPHELRADYILNITGNPYCFRVGDLGVKLEFPDNAPSLQDALSDFFQRKNCSCSFAASPEQEHDIRETKQGGRHP